MQRNSAEPSLFATDALFLEFDVVLVGLTGSIATGKSSVAKIFKRLGCYVISADELAHEVYKKGSPAYDRIIEEFTDKILDEHNCIDRKKLGSLVLNNVFLLNKLESIVHPEIERLRNGIMDKIKREDKDTVVIYDVPLLFEKKLDNMFDYTVVVYTNKYEEIKRLMRRDKLSEKEALKRINLQIPIEKKAQLADFVIDNSNGIEYTEKQVKELFMRFKRHG